MLGFGDGVDEGDVLTGLRRIIVFAEDRGPPVVLARVVPQQVIDGQDAEHLVEQARRLLTDDVVQPVGEGGHLLDPDDQRITVMPGVIGHQLGAEVMTADVLGQQCADLRSTDPPDLRRAAR